MLVDLFGSTEKHATKLMEAMTIYQQYSHASRKVIFLLKADNLNSICNHIILHMLLVV